MKNLKSILIANRGEIACRIIRTCQRLNIKTVAIYAPNDKNALHVKQADRSYCLDGNDLASTYLNIEQIIAIAKKEQVCAVHPGYGFLSENANFARACQSNDIVFIGPSPEVIELMAVKDIAKQAMIDANVPTVPGDTNVKTNEEIKRRAEEIGLPVMIKAACGGGGKGMRIVHELDTLKEAIRQAQHEALNAFGDDRLFIEKYLINARHIEVQIFRDQLGHCVHLFERDCSAQRRHQKIIEETPAIDLDDKTKQAMFECAIRAANAIDYHGAGTIEFLVAEHNQFYFIEMNTRIQVEHPVTEATTGFDLIEWQIKVAQGEAIPFTQQEICQQGHAIEARIYSEDPTQLFLPQTGTIKHIFHRSLTHTRLDAGIKVEDNISIYYDPLLCKLIAWGNTREEARQLLTQALKDFKIVGVKNNIDFLQRLLAHQAFKHGISVTYLEENISELIPSPKPCPDVTLCLAALAIICQRQQTASFTHSSPWDCSRAFRLNLPYQENMRLQYQDTLFTLCITHNLEDNSDHLVCDIGCEQFQKSLQLSGYIDNGVLHYCIENRWCKTDIYLHNPSVSLVVEGILFSFIDCSRSSQDQLQDHHDDDQIIAPMPGLVTKIFKQTGEQINKGDKLIALEAMKMEHTIIAPKSGTIKHFLFQTGEQVIEGAPLAEYQHEEENRV